VIYTFQSSYSSVCPIETIETAPDHPVRHNLVTEFDTVWLEQLLLPVERLMTSIVSHSNK
jgi:hypothetical protein